MYPGRGTAEVSDVSRQAKQIGLKIKLHRPSPMDGLSMIAYAARRLQQHFPLDQRDVFLGGNVTLIPAPGSSLLQPNSLWVPRLICERLVTEGMGVDVLPCLKRHTAVPKSAFAAAGERPTAQRHYETMAVDPVLVPPARICVVDDVVTKGATLLAAASLVKEAFPAADVRVLALARTFPFRPEHTRMDQPCVGTIHLRRVAVVREDSWTAWPIEVDEF